MNRRTELGDLAPIRDTLDWIEEWERTDTARRSGSDPVVRALGDVRKRLAAALAEAVNADLGATPEELARLEGVTRSAIYKRRRRGKLPEAQKRGGRIYIPLDAQNAA